MLTRPAKLKSKFLYFYILRINISLEKNQQGHQSGQNQAVPENVAQDAAFIAVPAGGSAV